MFKVALSTNKRILKPIAVVALPEATTMLSKYEKILKKYQLLVF